MAAPFVLLGWLLVGPWTIGNDYPVYQVEAALNLRVYERLAGVEPLWYPHLSGGFPVGGLVLGQAYHPPAWISSHLPGYWSGHALDWIAARHLVLFAVLHGLLYRGARRLGGLGRGAAWLLSFVGAYNLRTLDALRYGMALDAVVYTIAVVVLAGELVLRGRAAAAFALVAAVALLLTCGYPVLVPFGAAAGVLVVGACAVRAGVTMRVVAGRLATVAAACLAGALLAAPHLALFAEYVRVNSKRMQAASLAWASYEPLDASRLLANLLLPWHAEVHSGFGGATALTVVLLATVVLALRPLRRGWPVLLVLAALPAYAFGAASPFYVAVFRYVPGFSTLRTPGRALFVLPLLLVAALAWRRPTTEEVRAAVGVAARALAVVLALALLGTLWTRGGLGPGPLPRYAPASLSHVWATGLQALWLALGLVACASLGTGWGSDRGRVLLLGVATWAQTAVLLRHGTWMELRRPTPTLAEFRAADHLPLHGGPPLMAENDLMEGSQGLATVPYTHFVKLSGGAANCFAPVHRDARHKGILTPFYLSDAIRCVPHTRDALAALTDGRCRADTPLQTYMEGPGCAPAGEEVGPAALNAANALVELGPNAATLSVTTPRAAVLVTPYPDVPGWTATLDGREAPTVRVNGAFVGVRVPAGTSRVRVAYRSRAALLGMRLALLGVALVLGAAAAVLRARRWARPLAVAVLLGALALEQAWEAAHAARADRRVLLPNGHAALLREQLERWSAARP